MNRRRPDDSSDRSPDRSRRGARGRDSHPASREVSAKRSDRGGPAEAAGPPSTARTNRYAGAGAGAVAALFVAPIVTTPADAVAAGAGNLLALATLVAGVVWAFRRLRSPDRPMRWSAVDLPVLALALWIGLSGWWNASDGAPRPTLNACWTWIGLLASYWLARQWLRSPADCRAIAVVLFALTVAQSTYGVYQSVYAMPQARAAFQRNPDAALREIGVSAPPGSPQRAQYAARIASTEPVGTFSLTNSLAGLLVPWLLTAAGVVAAGRRSPSPLDAASPGASPGDSTDRAEAQFGRRARYALLAALTAVAFCLLLTKSRAGYVATAAGVGLIGLQTLRSRRRIPWRWCAAAGVGVGLAVGVAALAGLVDRQVLTEARKSLGYRWEYWTATSALIADRPLFGCGPGNFQSYYAGYKAPESSETVADPHNAAFEAAATAGLPAVFCLLLFVGLLGVRLLRSTTPGEPVRAAGAGPVADAPGLVPPPQEPSHDSPAESARDSSSDSRRWIYGGALGGVGLGAVASLLGQFAPDPFFMLVALPVAGLLVGLLDGWVRHGRLPAWTIGVALLGLLLNLQVAGALTFPGVIGSFWLLAAIGVRLTEPRSERPLDVQEAPAEAPSGRAAGFAALAIGLILVVACAVTGYRPVLLAQIELDLGDQYLKQGRFDAADEAYRAAAQQDRWSSEPPLRYAHLAARRLTAGDTSAFWFDRLQEATDSALRLNARAYVVRRELGDVHLAVWRSTGEPRALAESERLYAEAVRLYPHSNILRAQLAWTLHLAGDDAEARAAAVEALRLDALCPHREQQLKNQTLYDAPEGRPSGKPGPPTEDAERTMRRLTEGEPRPQTGKRSLFRPRAFAAVPSDEANRAANVASIRKANRPCVRS